MDRQIDTWSDTCNNANYFFEDGLAYTEDKILVYNIFAYKIPHKVKQEEAIAYFSQFGKVLKLHLVPDKKRAKQSAPKVGFIHFADPTSAVKVLERPHTLRGKTIPVKACDSWRQPQPKVDIAMDTYDGARNNGELTIMHLNDDCLEHICKKMDLRNQVNFARSCTRFSAVFKMYSKHQNKMFIMDNLHTMTLWEMHEFFKIAGSTIKTLTGSLPMRDRERISEFIANFCSNVTCIDFQTCRVNVSCLHKIVAKLKQIETLRLTNCSITDNALALMRKLPKLNELGLSENFDLQGTHLSFLTNVTDLNLHSCGNILAFNLVSLFKSLTHLRSLNMERIEQVTAVTFAEMAKHCKNLEVLKMSCPNIDYDCVAKLPKLRHLELIAVSPHVPIRQNLFMELAEHKAQQLEVLKIIARNSITYDGAVHIGRLEQLKLLMVCYNDILTDDFLRKFAALENLESIDIKHCPLVTNNGVLQLVRNCKKLERINMQRCAEITNHFVFDAIKELSKRHDIAKSPMILYVGKTKIDETMEKNEKVLSAEHLVKLSFPTPLSYNFIGDGYNDDNIDLYFDDDYDEDDFDVSDDDLRQEIEFDFLFHESDLDNSDMDDDYAIFAHYGQHSDEDEFIL